MPFLFFAPAPQRSWVRHCCHAYYTLLTDESKGMTGCECKYVNITVAQTDCLYICVMRVRSLARPRALTASWVQYFSSYDHPWRSASMLDTSCLKFLPLTSCTTPFFLHSLLFLLMISTIVWYPPHLWIFCFILFCFAASERVKWGRKWANAHNCLPVCDIYGPPHA